MVVVADFRRTGGGRATRVCAVGWNRDDQCRCFTAAAFGPAVIRFRRFEVDIRRFKNNERESTMRIVVAAPVMPFRGVSHAGGELLLRHLDLLAEEAHDVTLLVPRNTLMGRETKAPEAAYKIHIIDAKLPAGRARRIVRWLRLALVPFTRYRGFWDDVFRHPCAAEACRLADAIELQWFEMILTAKELGQHGVAAELYGVYHDVIHQRLEREVRSASGARRRALRYLRFKLGIFYEHRAARHVKNHLCFSEKDACLIQGFAAPSGRIYVLEPPLGQSDMPTTLDDLEHRPIAALMVADFGRIENAEAAEWVLRRVWPLVRKKHPECRLMLAGGNPSDSLLKLVNATPGVTATGYLPSLSPAYREVRVAISPALRGAGIKVKSIVPMLWGIPVIATEVGAEGIDRGCFIAVTDDPANFASVVARALTDPAAFEDVRRRAMASAQQRYSASAYRSKLANIYGD